MIPLKSPLGMRGSEFQEPGKWPEGIRLVISKHLSICHGGNIALPCFSHSIKLTSVLRQVSFVLVFACMHACLFVDLCMTIRVCVLR